MTDQIEIPSDIVIRHWSRRLGQWLNKETGIDVFEEYASTHPELSVQYHGIGPSFTGSVQDWYDTLIETIADAIGNFLQRHFRPTHEVWVVRKRKYEYFFHIHRVRHI